MVIHENATYDDLLVVLNILEQNGVTYWLDGGWGIDILTGQQRRTHRDVDIDFDSTRTTEILTLFQKKGWTVETDQLPCRAELYNPSHGYLDLHPFELLPDGRARQADLQGAWWNFEPDYFTAVFVAGRLIPCISPKGQRIFHSGYEWRDKDRIDMENLDRLGIFSTKND